MRINWRPAPRLQFNAHRDGVDVVLGAGLRLLADRDLDRPVAQAVLERDQVARAAGQFLVHQEVLGHIYGIPSAAVRKLQALGKLPLLDLDRVQDVEQLRASGFQVHCMGGMAPSR